MEHQRTGEGLEKKGLIGRARDGRAQTWRL